MNKFLKCFFIVSLNILLIISLLATGNQTKRTKRFVSLNNKSVNNLFDNQLAKLEINDANDLHYVITKKAFTAGMDIDGRVLYVCRVRVNNELIPGKYSQEFNKCAITYQNKEHKHNKYQLLVDPSTGSYQWSKLTRPVKQLPSNIVLGGVSITGQFYYIGQCRVHSHRIKRISEQIGKVHFDQSADQWIATVPFSGQEIQCFDYSVLIMV